MSQLALQLEAPSIPAQVSGDDHMDYMRLPAKERLYIDRNLHLFRLIEASDGPLTQRCEVAAAAARREGFGRGWSRQQIYRRYRLWSEGGAKLDADGQPTGCTFESRDWRALVRNYHPGHTGLPQEFIAYLVQLWSETTREKDAWRGVYSRLIRCWLSGESIPGYGYAQDWYRAQGWIMPQARMVRPQDLPTGWSESNLARALKKALPRKSQRRAAQGQVNRMATAWSAQLMRDRSQLMPMQLWTIDDVRLDLQARMFVDGKWQIVYVDALFALDVATGFVLAYGIKGMAIRGDGTELGRAPGTKMAIDSRDVRHLVLQVLERFGIPEYKSTLLCEMATAKLSGDDERSFTQLLQDRLEIDYTGMGRGQLLRSGFAEEWGRPGLKGWIEAYFRKLHTSINHLPGTTGRRYELTRGDHASRVRYTQQIIRRAEKLIDGPLSPDHPLMEQLNFPILSVEEVNGLVGEIVDALNWRTRHHLQGFERVFEFRDAEGQWRPEAELARMDPAERVGIELQPRMESPAERLQRLIRTHAPHFQKLDPAVLCALYSDKRSATVRGGRIAIQDHRLSNDRLVFSGEDSCLDGYEGRQNSVLAYIAPDYSHAVLSDVFSGAHVATLWREERVDLCDEAALARRAGEVHRAQEEDLARVRDYLGPHEQLLSSMRDNNEAILSQPRPVAAEVAQGRLQAREDRTRAAGIRRSTNAAARQIESRDFDFADIAAPQADSAAYSLDDIAGILSENSEE